MFLQLLKLFPNLIGLNEIADLPPQGGFGGVGPHLPLPHPVRRGEVLQERHLQQASRERLATVHLCFQLPHQTGQNSEHGHIWET